MNTKQLLVLWVGIGIAVGMLLFPPYLTAGGHHAIVYRFLLSPPPLVSKDAGGLIGAMAASSEASNLITVPPAPLDAAVLLAQLGIVGLLTLGLTLTLRGGITRDTLNGHIS